MKNGFAWMGAAVAALSILGTSSAALASSHREAPAISMDPAADNTDLWAWNSGGNLHLVACYIPLEEPSGGPNFHKFGDDVLYEIHVARGDASLADVVTYQIKFTTAPGPADPAAAAPTAGDPAAPLISGAQFFSQISGASQTYSVTAVAADGTKTSLATGVPVAPPNIGPRTDALVYGGGVAGKTDPSYTNQPDQFLAKFVAPLTGGGQVFAGPRDDGFYVDLGGIFDLANLRGTGTAQDGVAGFNTHAISIDIPDANVPAAVGSTDANKDIAGIWASASRRKVRVLRADGSTSGYGPWVQVSRLGLPLVNEAVIGLQDKDKYNRTQPATDVGNFGGYILTPILVQDASAVGVYGTTAGVANPPPAAALNNRVDIVGAINAGHMGGGFDDLSAVGDVLRVNLTAATAEPFPAGRALPDDGTATNAEPADVTDVLLSLIITANVADGVNHNDTNYPGTFPYLARPWAGFGEGHGKPTPL